MKYRLFAAVLALSMAAWAQGNSSTATNASAPVSKSCCHTAGAGNMGSCQHATGDAKDGYAGCCDGKCNMNGGKSSCTGKEMKQCMKQCKKQGKNNGGCEAGKCCISAGGKSAMKCCDGCARNASDALPS